MWIVNCMHKPRCVDNYEEVNYHMVGLLTFHITTSPFETIHLHNKWIITRLFFKLVSTNQIATTLFGGL